MVSGTDITGPITITQSGVYNITTDVPCSSGDCIIINSSNVTIDGGNHNLSGTSSSWAGINITTGSWGVNISNITIIGFNQTNTGVGIVGMRNSTSILHNLNVSNNYEGIVISDTNISSIYQNKLINNSIGLNLSSASNNSIAYNTFQNNLGTGIELISSNYSSVSHNNFTKNGQGINLFNSHLCNLTGNNISTSSMWGVLLNESSNSSINGNYIVDNEYGIVTEIIGNGNIFFNNYFNNGDNVNFSSTSQMGWPNNTWNITNSTGPNIIGGPFFGGNYWANSSGTGYSQTCNDTTGDGFCDIPYSVKSNDFDYLPLHITQQGSHIINATAGAGGTISPSGLVPVLNGANQTFSITPNTGYTITDLRVDDRSLGPNSTHTFSNVTTNHTISASFNQTSTAYTINASAGSGGIIIPNGSIQVISGSNQTFSITPNTGYMITDLRVDDRSLGPNSTHTFSNVTANHTISASFNQTSTTYTINASAGSGGIIIPNGSIQVISGSNQTFSITPNTGYTITDLRVDDRSLGPNSTHTFSNVTANHTISASFNQTSTAYTINASAGSGGRIIPNGSIQVISGSNLTFNISTISPVGMTIDTVMVDNQSQGAIWNYTFTNVTANHTIYASFKVPGPLRWFINATATPGGLIDPSGLVSVFNGNNKTFTITASPNFNISNIIINNITNLGAQTSPYTYNFTNVTSDQSILAQFTGYYSNYAINSSSNEWSDIVPYGNNSYPVYSNQTFINQGKPGSTLAGLQIDNIPVAVADNYTFTNLTKDHSIHVNGGPKPGQVHIFFNASSRYGQMPLSVTFNDQSLGSPTSYYWQFGDGTNNTTANPVHTYGMPGIYTVTLRAENNQSGGYGVWSNFITVTRDAIPEPTPTPVPSELSPAFIVTPQNGTVPLLIQCIDQSTGNPVSWIWDFGDGTVSTQQNPTHQYVKTGKFSVTLLVQNKNYSGSLTKPDIVTISG